MPWRVAIRDRTLLLADVTPSIDTLPMNYPRWTLPNSTLVHDLRASQQLMSALVHFCADTRVF